MKIKKILTAFAIVSVVSLGNLFAQGISCERTSRSESWGLTFSTYEFSNGCTYQTMSASVDNGPLVPIIDIESCD